VVFPLTGFGLATAGVATVGARSARSSEPLGIGCFAIDGLE
jgi:hypothetical protein